MIRCIAPAVVFAVLFCVGSLGAAASTLHYPEAGMPASGFGLIAWASGPVNGYFVGHGAAKDDSAPSLDRGTDVVGPTFILNDISAVGAPVVGFEDRLRSPHADADNDATVVFAGVQGSSVLLGTPEPGSLALLGSGALSAVALLRRRRRPIA